MKSWKAVRFGTPEEAPKNSQTGYSCSRRRSDCRPNSSGKRIAAGPADDSRSTSSYQERSIFSRNPYTAALRGTMANLSGIVKQLKKE